MLPEKVLCQANKEHLKVSSVTELVQTSSVRASRQIFQGTLMVNILIQGRLATDSYRDSSPSA